MNLPRSTYYHKPKSKTGNDRELIERIEAIIEEFPGYGYRRVTHELHRRDVAVNHKKVLRLMRQRGLIRKPKRRWIRTTNSDHHCRIYPNLLKNLAVTGLSEPGVGSGYHLHRHPNRVCVPGGHPGSVCPQGRRICHLPFHRYGPLPGGT